MGDITKVRTCMPYELPVSQDIGAFCVKILPDIEIGNVNYKIRNILEFCITHIISMVCNIHSRIFKCIQIHLVSANLLW